MSSSGRDHRQLEVCGYATQAADTYAAARTIIDHTAPDAIVVDVNAAAGERLLRSLLAGVPGPVVVALTPAEPCRAAELAVSVGAYLLPRSAPTGALGALLERTLSARRCQQALAFQQQHQLAHYGIDHLIGDSPGMLRLKAQVRLVIDAERAAERPSTRGLLIHGEVGTGRERVARCLHVESRRAGQAFAVLDGDDVAACERADGGTIFVPELANTSPSIQHHVVDRLTRGRLRRVGSPGIDTLLVVATRRTDDELADGGFVVPQLRRLLSTTLVLPPLRERADDLWFLARRFIADQAARQGVEPPLLDRSARQALCSHDWPGNVRELRNVLERAVLLQRHGIVTAADLGPMRNNVRDKLRATTDLDLHRLEQDAMLRALERSKGNVSRAARLLGIGRDAMRYRMVKRDVSTSTVAPWRSRT